MSSGKPRKRLSSLFSQSIHRWEGKGPSRKSPVIYAWAHHSINRLNLPKPLQRKLKAGMTQRVRIEYAKIYSERYGTLPVSLAIRLFRRSKIELIELLQIPEKERAPINMPNPEGALKGMDKALHQLEIIKRDDPNSFINHAPQALESLGAINHALINSRLSVKLQKRFDRRMLFGEKYIEELFGD